MKREILMEIGKICYWFLVVVAGQAMEKKGK